MPTPAISIHDPSTTPSAVAVMPTARASGRRLAVGNTPTMPVSSRGVGVDAVLRARVGGGLRRRQSQIQPATSPPRNGGHQQQRRAGRVAADEPVDRADHGVEARRPADPQDAVSSLTASDRPRRSRTVVAPVSASGAARRCGSSSGDHGCSGIQRESWSGRSCHACGRADGADVGVVHPAEVEHRPLRADRRQPREVVRRTAATSSPTPASWRPTGRRPRSSGSRSDRTTLIANGTNDSDQHDHAERRDQVQQRRSRRRRGSRRPAAACRRGRGCASRRTSC